LVKVTGKNGNFDVSGDLATFNFTVKLFTWNLTLKIKAVRSFETSASVPPTTRRHKPHHQNLTTPHHCTPDVSGDLATFNFTVKPFT
jgi:hypothetical protein